MADIARVLGFLGTATCILLGWALLNGYPFVYPDTQGYLGLGQTVMGAAGLQTAAEYPTADEPAASEQQGGDRGAVGSSDAAEERLHVFRHSLYFSAFSALPFPFRHPWTATWVQALAIVAVLALAFRTLGGTVASAPFVVLISALTLMTPLGVFGALVMPDVWVGIMVVSAALMVAFGDRLAPSGILLASTTVGLGAVFHTSHFAVLVLLFLSAGALMVLGPWRQGLQIHRRGAGGLAVLIGLSLGALALQNRVVARTYEARVVRPPHLTARLIDGGGPGMDLIEARCPEIGFTVCNYQQGLPVEWRHFLFVFPIKEGTTPPELAIASEDMAFAIATFAHDPAGVVGLAIAATLEQLTRFSFETAPIREGIREATALGSFPPTMIAAIRAGALFELDWLYTVLSQLAYAAVLISVVLLVLGGAKQGPLADRLSQPAVRTFALFIVLGVVGNAAVCGFLASPYDRFQARIVWVLPALAMLIGIPRQDLSSTPHGELENG
ncbi:MAG: hypothetical protein AAFZ18_02880 [Myxococcota bacterium]